MILIEFDSIVITLDVEAGGGHISLTLICLTQLLTELNHLSLLMLVLELL
jgi:hypothetical protein